MAAHPSLGAAIVLSRPDLSGARMLQLTRAVTPGHHDDQHPAVLVPAGLRAGESLICAVRGRHRDLTATDTTVLSADDLPDA